jgi:eukaryotic-like serine/threonine-protein kinase
MYVAPEALSGEVVSPAADQYSLATMAYQFLTGTLPYTAKSPREMFTQLLSQPPVPLNKARPEIVYAAGVEEVVMRGLAKAPKDRYDSVISFADALATALTDPFPTKPAADSSGLFSKMKGLFGR